MIIIIVIIWPMISPKKIFISIYALDNWHRLVSTFIFFYFSFVLFSSKGYSQWNMYPRPIKKKKCPWRHSLTDNDVYLASYFIKSNLYLKYSAFQKVVFFRFSCFDFFAFQVVYNFLEMEIVYSGYMINEILMIKKASRSFCSTWLVLRSTY